jgi:hypothetical protein
MATETCRQMSSQFTLALTADSTSGHCRRPASMSVHRSGSPPNVWSARFRTLASRERSGRQSRSSPVTRFLCRSDGVDFDGAASPRGVDRLADRPVRDVTQGLFEDRCLRSQSGVLLGQLDDGEGDEVGGIG